ncbi:hypothetical protein Q8A67_023110 [Cirrhinus molitorella]|uniref:Uncharacterized protein n=1 Tax=Cirrhinus molitorella TaxID=172907 RepID=A0AA88TE27_9TELE|nr:hypothetical protein Q8A67_023110 [Cirrhinus molitorella]
MPFLSKPSELQHVAECICARPDSFVPITTSDKKHFYFANKKSKSIPREHDLMQGAVVRNPRGPASETTFINIFHVKTDS